MKLKRQLRPQPRRAPRTGRGARAARTGATPRGRQARRPGTPLRRRIGGRLPSIRRLLAGLGAVAAAAGLVALLGGPWLQVTQVTWAGEQFTAARDLERVLDGQRGTSLLAVDTGSLRSRIERLPAVSEATVTASLPGRLEVTIVEHEAAFVWETSSARLLGAADGTLFAALPADAPLSDATAALPLVADQRAMSRLITAGDRIPESILRTALRLAGIDPAALGSSADELSVRLDDEFGFGLVAAQPGWEMAFGVYGTDPNETAGDAAARLERQVTAVRTLFTTRAEAGIGWVDARNPGKVYFRAKG
ncbi:MAG TPA: FtsQ-type POTRA domain-containing protein [Candidatus Limnocylindrales bacterium]|nr:FtsQ-type POTRA domain-containing protein [Candidatus Limnocylindrales bacterium]